MVTKVFADVEKHLCLYICHPKQKALKNVLISSALLLLSATQVTAQEKETLLDPVTVTSSLHSIKSSSTGRNIFVIKGDDIAALPVHSLDELLRYVPGIEVQSRGPMGAQSDIVMRGGTFQQVLVIVDGLRLNDPNTGHFNAYIPIAPTEIERIEVLKGASSAIYGSDAVGGVINIITKAFDRQQKHNTLQAETAAGSYGSYRVSAGGFYGNGKTSINGGLLSNNADGAPQRGTTGFFNNNTVSLAISHNFNAHWRINFGSSFDSRKFAAQNYYTAFTSDTANEKVQSFWNRLKLEYQKNKGHFSINAGYKTLDDTYQYNPISTANTSTSKLWQLLAVYEYSFNKSTTLVTGANFQSRNISSNDRGNHSVKQLAAFGILQMEPVRNFTVSPALRVDHDDNAGTELVPQINLSYKLKQVQLRGSIGKTIRQADFTEQYNNYNKALVTSGRIGNPNLAAERSLSYELGADIYASKDWKLAATVFQKDYSKLIDWVNTSYAQMPRRDNLSPTGVYALASNIANVTTSGVETDLQFVKKLGGNQRVLFTAGILWLKSQSSDSVPSLYVSSHAKLLTNFSLLYTIKRFSISVNGIYKTRAEQAATAIKAELSKDYFILNAKASFIVYKKVGLFVQADNLFNRSYADLLGSPMPGRWLMGGVSWVL